jgi:hypothetical protein
LGPYYLTDGNVCRLINLIGSTRVAMNLKRAMVRLNRTRDFFWSRGVADSDHHSTILAFDEEIPVPGFDL